jgi:hypothetical protein
MDFYSRCAGEFGAIGARRGGAEFNLSVASRRVEPI